MGFPFARVEASPFARRLASQHGRIEFTFITDDSVRLPLLPTPPHGDAVTVGYQAGVGLPEEGLHLLGQNALASARAAASRRCWPCGTFTHVALPQAATARRRCSGKKLPTDPAGQDVGFV